METFLSPVKHSLVRPRLVAGGNRDMMMPLAMFALAIVLTSPLEWSILLPAAVLVGVCYWGLVRLTKYDPDWHDVMRRHLLYRKFYAAGGHPLLPKSRPKPSVPPMRFLH